MGVLVHPNYSDELANGVAVSFDPFSGRKGAYYVNTQVGEDLVTNPEAHSVPEEILLLPDGSYEVLVYSNLKEPKGLLMSDAQMTQLRRHLKVIHERFAALYNPPPGQPFAMEIEFKITSANILSIKQARPWVFPGNSSYLRGVTFDDEELWPFTHDIIEYTVGQATPLNFRFPEASGGAGPLTYHLDNRSLRVPISEYAQGLTFDAATRTLSSGVGPDEPAAGQRYALEYWAEDQNGSQDSAYGSIEVNGPPSLPTTANQSFTAGETVSVALPTATGGSAKIIWLRYRLEPEIPGLSFDTGSRTISGTPTATGSTTMTYTVTDRNGVSDTETFTIAVVGGSAAPTSPPASVQAAQIPWRKYFAVTWTEVPVAPGYAVQVAAQGDNFPTDDGVSAWPPGILCGRSEGWEDRRRGHRSGIRQLPGARRRHECGWRRPLGDGDRGSGGAAATTTEDLFHHTHGPYRRRSAGLRQIHHPAQRTRTGRRLDLHHDEALRLLRRP